VKDFRSLKVWERSHQLTLDVYGVTVGFPREERYGLTSQIRRCSASIGANIAEGCGKRGNGEFQRYLQIASGSASELDYHFLLARDLNFIVPSDYERLAAHLSVLRRMLTALLQKVEGERVMAKCQVLNAKC
jgi:four helix bundle protein